MVEILMSKANSQWQANLGKEMRRGLLSVLLLWILRRKGAPMYGYEIIQTIETTTNGHWIPKPGTLYPILRRLEKRGYVKSEWSKTKATGPNRRYYRITPDGCDAAKMIFTEWKRHIGGFRDFLAELLEVE